MSKNYSRIFDAKIGIKFASNLIEEKNIYDLRIYKRL